MSNHPCGQWAGRLVETPPFREKVVDEEEGGRGRIKGIKKAKKKKTQREERVVNGI